MNIKEILLGEGLGDIQFGMTKNQVEAVLGKPDESETHIDNDDGEIFHSEHWHYDEYEISLAFDEIETLSLIHI